MFVNESNWIGIADSPVISKEYLEDIKLRTKVDPQPEKPPFVRVSTKLYAKMSAYPYKSVLTRRVLDYIMLTTWGMAGKTIKRDMEKVCLVMSQEYMAEQLKCTKGILIKALKELIDAKIILVQNNKGKTKDGKRYANYYFINKHYDTWIYPKGIVGNTIAGNTIVGNTIVGNTIAEHTIQYDEKDLSLGDTTAFPIDGSTMARFLEFSDKETINKLAIIATCIVRGMDITGTENATKDRYYGIIFQELGKIRDGAKC